MVVLGVKESVSGKRFTLTKDGDEIRVCGGKGAVYLSGPKVALRCCAKTSIIATRKAKQSVLRQGDVLLLDVADTFYANGTLTKYQVIQIDRQVTVSTSHIQGISHSNAITSSYFQKKSTKSALQAPAKSAEAPVKPMQTKNAVEEETKKNTSPIDVSDVDQSPLRSSKRPMEATEAITSKHDDDEEDSEVFVRKVKAKKARAIVDSEDEEEKEVELKQRPSVTSNISSPAEDDVYLCDMERKSQKKKPTPDNWMKTYGRGNQTNRQVVIVDDDDSSADDDGWQSVKNAKKPVENRTIKRDRPVGGFRSKPQRFVGRNDDGDDDMDEDHSVRSHDEVGQLLRECERIADKLRRSIEQWSDTKAKEAEAEEEAGAENDDHVSLATIAADSTSPTSSRRIFTQADIPDACETLVLKPYQVVGLNWLKLLHENNLSGVLADEMGLGKTVQTISFLLLLETLARKQFNGVSGAGPHLIVVPASVLNNWKREFAWIAPTLRIVVYHGSRDDRLDLQEELTAEDDAFDVLLTTYTYFERDSCQDDRNFFRNFRFGYMILDEGHSIKNAKTSRFKRISVMRARIRLVLSGTPIQNNLNELLALLSFLMPRMFDHGSDELLSFFDGTEEKKCAKIRKILAPFILRREKKYVLNQLVPKTIVVEMVELPPPQQQIYTNLIESVIQQKENEAARKQKEKEEQKAMKSKRSKLDRQLQLLLGDNGRSSKALKSTSDSTMGNDAAVFTQLRKAANHPILLRNHYVSDDQLTTLTRCLHRAEAFGNQCTMAMVRKELETYSDFELHDLCVQYGANPELKALQLPMETLIASAKFTVLRKLLPQLQSNGHRVLIFSQWTKLLDLLQVLMEFLGYRYLRLDGSTDVNERQTLIDEYNHDHEIFVFLLSTRAGGLGINLTAADTVILHDLDFNPTNDEQACDRCHRIGQLKPVTIYKLVAKDTVDHAIFKLGETKTQLNHAVLGKLNAQQPKKSKTQPDVTVEMMLASVLSSYKSSHANE